MSHIDIGARFQVEIPPRDDHGEAWAGELVSMPGDVCEEEDDGRCWGMREGQLFKEGMEAWPKDFSRIQKMMCAAGCERTVKELVKFYYENKVESWYEQSTDVCFESEDSCQSMSSTQDDEHEAGVLSGKKRARQEYPEFLQMQNESRKKPRTAYDMDNWSFDFQEGKTRSDRPAQGAFEDKREQQRDEEQVFEKMDMLRDCQFEDFSSSSLDAWNFQLDLW